MLSRQTKWEFDLVDVLKFSSSAFPLLSRQTKWNFDLADVIHYIIDSSDA